jgi:lipopolysaccharide biosynthesis glycosyltransferase
MLNIFVGYDEREAIAYHNFVNSVIVSSSTPVSLTPLALNTLKGYTESHTDGSNDFIYSRFLVPYISDFKGVALFVDGDMICQSDIKELFDLFDPSKAVQVVKHSYLTKFNTKYLGNKNGDYPCKNWSSVILFNCEHPANKVLTPEFVSSHDGKYLHRFSWLDDDDIGELPDTWNYLVLEYPDNYKAKLLHYTIGTPCFKEYSSGGMADLWYNQLVKTIAPLRG